MRRPGEKPYPWHSCATVVLMATGWGLLIVAAYMVAPPLGYALLGIFLIGQGIAVAKITGGP